MGKPVCLAGWNRSLRDRGLAVLSRPYQRTEGTPDRFAPLSLRCFYGQKGRAREKRISCVWSTDRIGTNGTRLSTVRFLASRKPSFHRVRKARSDSSDAVSNPLRTGRWRPAYFRSGGAGVLVRTRRVAFTGRRIRASRIEFRWTPTTGRGLLRATRGVCRRGGSLISPSLSGRSFIVSFQIQLALLTAPLQTACQAKG